MSYAAKLLQGIQARIDGTKKTDFTPAELAQMEFDTAAFIIAGQYPDAYL